MMVITWAAMKSICSGVVFSRVSRVSVVFVVSCVFVMSDGVPSRYRSIRCCGMGSMNGGWLRVVGFVEFCLFVDCCAVPF